MSVPKEARRRFSSLASMLEIADREFRSLRDELETYERDVPQRIQSAPQEVEIDKASLTAFFEQNSLVREVDQEIADAVPDSDVVPVLPVAVEDIAARLKSVRITTIRYLETKLGQNRALLPDFAYEWLRTLPRRSGTQPQGYQPRGFVFVAGVSVFYLASVLMAQTSDIESIEELVEDAGMYSAGESAREVAEHILETYQSISEHLS